MFEKYLKFISKAYYTLIYSTDLIFSILVSLVFKKI